MAKSDWDVVEEAPLPPGWDVVAEDPAVAYPPDIVPAPVAQAPQGPAWWEAAFPRSTEAAGAPWYSPQALAAAGLDAASLPWRAATAGVQQAAQAAGGGEGPTLAQDVARLGGDPETGGFAQFAEGAARSPLNTIAAPLMAARAPAWLAAQAPGWLRGGVAGVELGANAGNMGMQSLRAASRAIPVGVGAAGVGQAERVSAGAPLSARAAATDFALAPLLGATGPAISAAGSGFKTAGVEALRQVVKPTMAEIDGFYRAMQAGLLPEAAGPFTASAGAAGNRFINRLKARRELEYAPAVAEAEASGATVNMSRVEQDAMNHLRGELDARNVAGTESTMGEVRDWLSPILQYRDAAGRDALALANKPIPGRYVPLQGTREVLTPRTTITGVDAFGMPITKTENVVSGYRPTVEGFQKLPDYLQPIPDVVAPVVQAHRLKSALQDLAYAGDPKATAPKAAIVAATKGADRAIRGQIAEVSPKYAEADARMAPWYAGRDAFERAADVRGNNYMVDMLAGGLGAGAGAQSGLGGLLTGLVGAPALVRYARSPALARHLWEAGRFGQAVGGQVSRNARLAPLLAPQTDNARGAR